MSNGPMIVRFTNNTAAWPANSLFDGLASGESINVPASACSIRYNANGSLNRVYVQNDVIAHNELSADDGNDFASLGTGQFNVARIEVVDNYGYGRVLARWEN